MNTAKKRFTIYQLSVCALMAALMCVLGPMSIPIGPIPVSLINFVIFLTVYVLSTKAAVTSYLIYLLIGAAGMGVFSGYEGGMGKLAGPTGGYLVGYIFAILLCGFIMKKSHSNTVITIIGMIVANMVAYLFGTVWFVLQMQCDVWYALTVCVFPFIPFDIAKILIASALGKTLRTVLIKSHLLPEQK